MRYTNPRLLNLIYTSKAKEKFIDTNERLKAVSVEKFTLDGREFHTLTVVSAKYLLRVLLTQLGLYCCKSSEGSKRNYSYLLE